MARCICTPARKTLYPKVNRSASLSTWTASQPDGYAGAWVPTGGSQQGLGQGLDERQLQASHPTQLHTVGQHDKAMALLLPHQTPEVTHRLGQGTLGCNEFLGAPETLDVETKQ